MSVHASGGGSGGREPPDIDSTQTLRAIPEHELYDSNRPKWFVIQLVASDRPVNLDMMPRLEVFSDHRLYAVITGRKDNGFRYALRLGFFPDQESAQAICGQLTAFFATPSIVQVSAAEHARFVAPPAVRPKPPSVTTSTPAVTAAAPLPRPSVTPKPLAPSAGAKAAAASSKAHASHKPARKNKTLAEELLDEAREVQLSRSGKHRVAAQRKSWLARLLGR
ncbi:MAG TPA: hypothetical protein VJQ52_03330 [Steroidobacteraceae bacterium]|nr:hypothetical protein [Steroidobacteraceae bacterium]